MRTPFATALLPVLALAGLASLPLRAQTGGQCPNQRASLVPAADGEIPPFRKCTMQVHVLGVVISIGWRRCPAGRTHVPAHQECLGVFAPGMRCTEEGIVPVELEICRCVPHLSHGTSFTSCECHEAGVMSFLPTGQTSACE